MTLNPIVTLTTDFGNLDPYVGIMKGVILGLNPRARLVDLTHGVTPQQVRQASFLLGTSFRYFPPGTIHLAVVDPGVGGSRRALALQAGGYYFVAPDNGILSHALAALGLRRARPVDSPAPVEARHASPAPGSGTQVDSPALTRLKKGIRAVSLTEPRFWLHPVSATFHGRDVFAPVAAHLSRGVPLEDLGEQVSSILLYPVSGARRHRDGTILGQVVHVDRFGNLVTDIREEDIPGGHLTVAIAGRVIRGLSPSYSSARAGDGPALLAIIGSTGCLEVSVRNGSAQEVLGVGVGEPVVVSLSNSGNSPEI